MDKYNTQGTHNLFPFFINPMNVVEVANDLLRSKNKKWAKNKNYRSTLNELLAKLNTALHDYRFRSTTDRIYLSRIDSLEHDLITLIDYTREIVTLLQ